MYFSRRGCRHPWYSPMAPRQSKSTQSYTGLRLTGDDPFCSILVEKFFFKKNKKINIYNSFTFTADWCWVSEYSGADPVPAEASHIFTMLSFPPLARYLPSGLHLRPHTSCVWLSRVATWCSATRTSWWWIFPDRDPLQEREIHLKKVLFFSPNKLEPMYCDFMQSSFQKVGNEWKIVYTFWNVKKCNCLSLTQRELSVHSSTASAQNWNPKSWSRKLITSTSLLIGNPTRQHQK